ncbi:DNA cytosine methyltransferase [Candidatus Poriferisocius sp.]|uniref:DNA cytosine methyltransferase n=1 Tax=Candidatus Poriferisocius sp. TaxID=3101276 RepID=UPI003B595CCA
MSADRLSSVDLFSGAGGLVLGLRWAGFDTLLANDNWAPAVETLKHNFDGARVSPDDIRDLSAADLLTRTDGVTPLLVTGGPPCQGFTSAGARRASDHRNTLVKEFARMVAELHPQWFLFENVEGFLTMSGGDFVVDLLDGVLDGGYQVRLQKVNVANYGVPQLRKRVIAIGLLGGDPGFPSPSHHAYGAPGAEMERTTALPLAPTVADSLDGIGAPASSVQDEVVQGHIAPPISESDALRFQLLQQGQTMRDLPKDLQHRSYARRANRRVADGMPTERRGGAPAGLRRLRADEPSKAITSAATREFLHPLEDRCLTLRECSRLQGFPDSFEFVGNRSEQATLIGNAIPPNFGEVFGGWVAERSADSPSSIDSSARLLEFRVTNGAGMSPALHSVVRRINARYRIGEVPLWS